MSESESEISSENFNLDEDFYNIIQKYEQGKNSQLANTQENVNNPTQMQKKKRKRIFNWLRNDDIKSTIFCPKCGGQHKFSTCTVQMKYNSFDQLRQSYSKVLFKDGDWHEREREGEDKDNKSFHKKK